MSDLQKNEIPNIEQVLNKNRPIFNMYFSYFLNKLENKSLEKSPTDKKTGVLPHILRKGGKTKTYRKD